MSACLHCGDCCRRMSPISAPAPCPHLVANGSYVFCGIYAQRPEQCRTHDFPAHRFCPIGMDVLRPDSADVVRERIDHGAELAEGLA